MKEIKEYNPMEYWKEAIMKAKEAEELIWDNHDKESDEKGEYSILIDEYYYNKLKEICKSNNLISYTFLVSAIKVSLSKYLFNKDITIGIPCYRNENQKKIIFNKVLPLISNIDYNQSFLKYMMNIKNEILQIYKNQFYLSSKILQDENINSLMDLLPINICMNGLQQKKDIDYILNSSKSQLVFLLESIENESKRINVVYNKKKLSESKVKVLGNILLNVLKSVLVNYNQKISEIELLSEEEKKQILYKFNATELDYPKDKTIQELFEEQVEKTPDNIAVVFNEKKLTYRELNEKANRVARILREKGVNSESIVGIMVEKSLEMVVGIIGILKSGGAYLPIDVSYPKERIQYMISDSKCSLILSKQELVSNIEVHVEVIEIFKDEVDYEGLSNLDNINSLSDLAYIIYTSGTTGKPKGVMIEHSNLIAYVKAFSNEFVLNSEDAVLQQANYCFDGFVDEFYPILLVGGKLVVCSKYDALDMNKLETVIKEHKISLISCSPLFLNELNKCNNLKSVKTFISGGDVLKENHFNNLITYANIYNTYGPTETTVGSNFYRCNELGIDNIPIGKPIKNYKCYVLDKAKNMLPIGIAGELYIGGKGVARGYLNKPELTEEKFINNPFEAGTKMYKTGDLVRWTQDGDIEFIGRIDEQVKIRGFRIELGEIENRLLKHEDIKETIVLVKQTKEKEKYICAYVISEKDVKELNLRGYLKEGLPEYMIPSYFVQIEKMPITHNGKINKRELPEPNLEETINEYEAPRSELEKVLTKIWSGVLGIEKVGINDNFFELGGHSLKATLLISKIQKTLNKDISLKELFRLPTIKQLSEFVENGEQIICSKIEKSIEKDKYETSSAQNRMYMLWQFKKDSTVYNMPAVFELEGNIDKNKIEETFRKITLRHESLRTYFEFDEYKIMQCIDNSYEFKLNVRQENENIEAIINNFIRPFDLDKAPLLRVDLVESKGKKYLMIDMHHIIADGLSTSILMKEFTKLYNGKELEALKLQYKDFAEWQNKFLKSEKVKRQEEYWLSMFDDEVPVLNMPTDYERPAVQSFEGDSVRFKVDKKITGELRMFAKETGTTLHMVLLSVFTILLSKYSGQEDIVVGIPISGRMHADLENIIGMFVNTLALRNKPKANKRYIDFLMEVKENSLKAYENGSYQIEELIEKLNVERDASRNPVFDVVFNMDNIDYELDFDLNGLMLKQLINENKVSKFDLALTVDGNGDELEFMFQYCSNLYSEESISRMRDHYIKILKTICKNREVNISEIEILTKDEKNKMLLLFRGETISDLGGQTVLELFEDQVDKTPENIAVIFKDTHLTYRQLNEKSNSLARILRNKGIGPNDIVAIMIGRSLEMIIGIMGILKAGGAYLSIDPTYPRERIEFILNDSGSKLLLSSKELLGNIQYPINGIDLNGKELFMGDDTNLEKINNCNDLAYVIYTSGTTGRPKGVMIEHKALAETLIWKKEEYKFGESSVMLSLFNYVFDGFVVNFFPLIISGSKFILASDEEISDPYKQKEYICRLGVTHYVSVPSIYLAMLYILQKKDVENLQVVTLAGERMLFKVIEETNKLNEKIEIINEYGPTENTVATTIMRNVQKKNKILIGKPIANTNVYIVNQDGDIQPFGVTGELCIGGSRLARGYLNREDLTSQKFVTSSFDNGEKIYKTGDLARWFPDGNIEFIDRIDDQVKIRGHRIEVGEIENAILSHKNIKEAVVVTRENKGNEKYLCAYVVCKEDMEKLELIKYLKQKLPQYMIPFNLMYLEKLPLTANGKINKKALPEPDIINMSASEYEAPRNELEEKLMNIWKEVLQVNEIGINDNFFDLGGHSLKATILVGKIHQALNVQIPVKEVITSGNIRNIGEYIVNANKNYYKTIKIADKKDYYEVSSAQKRMYILQQLDKNSIAYNMPMALEVEGDFQVEKVNDIFLNLIKRHESLRTSFHTKGEDILQKVHDMDEIQFQIEISDLNETDGENRLQEKLKEFVKPFNLEKAPLLKVKIIKTSNNKYVMILDMHHIISDGTSMAILTKEFSKLYANEELEDLRIQYKDYSIWQLNNRETLEFKSQEEYWIKEFSGEIPRLNLITDYNRQEVKSFNASSIKFVLNKEITSSLNKIAKETGCTMYMILLANIKILLSKYSGQKDIIVGMPIAGRNHNDLQNIVGMFINTLAIRTTVEDELDFRGYLKRVKEKTLKAFENQDYQFEELVDKVVMRRSLNRNPIFDIMFVLQNIEEAKIEVGDVIFKNYEFNSEEDVEKFDITMSAVQLNDEIHFNISYATRLYDKQTIERMAELLKDIIILTSNCLDKKIIDIELKTSEEKKTYFEEFKYYDSNEFDF